MKDGMKGSRKSRMEWTEQGGKKKERGKLIIKDVIYMM